MVQLFSAIVVARLLTPDQIGLFAVSFAVLLLVNGLRGLGVGAYIIQSDSIDTKTLKGAFTLVFLMGVSLALSINIAAPIWSDLYSDAGMEGILRILSINFLIFPFTIMVQSKATRLHDFGWLALSELIAALVSSAVTITLAILDFGAIALTVGTIVFSFISTVMCGFRHFTISEYGFTLHKTRVMVAFGGWVMGSNIIHQLNIAIVDLVIGKIQNLTMAGLFDRAATVNRLVWEQLYPALGQVLFASFAEENRAGKDTIKAYFYRLRCVLDLLWPLLIWLAVFGDFAVLILFGEQWVAAGPIARILAIAAAFSVPFAISKELGVALGKTKEFFQLDSLIFLMRFVLVVLAANYGIEIVAISLIVPAVFYMVFSQRLLHKTIGFSGAELMLVIYQPLKMGLIIVALFWAARYGIDEMQLGLTTAFILAASVACLIVPIILRMSKSPLQALVINKLK
jgi:O-antigen/teichoic acid export membrane protein